MVMAKIDRAPMPKPMPKPLPTVPGRSIGPGGCIPIPDPIAKPSTFDIKDTNDDGKLNADEFNANRSIKEQLFDGDKFDRYDSDNDGYVTRAEDFVGRRGDALRSSRLGLPDLGAKLKPGIDPDPGIRLTPKADQGPPPAEADAFKLGRSLPDDVVPGV